MSNAGDCTYPNQVTRVSFPTALPAVLTTPDETTQRPNKTLKTKEHKKSVLDLRRHFASGRSTPSENSGTPFRELISIWSRFPSHTRAERTGPAGDADGVVARDFVASAAQDGGPASTGLPDGSGTACPDTTFDNAQAFGKSNVKSVTLREPLSSSPAGRARKGRKGILGKWKRLYRSSSSDLRKYAQYHGHRSSLSLGDAAEYPELECLPGGGSFTETHALRFRASLDGHLGEDQTPEQQEATRPAWVSDSRARPGAIEWGKYYGDCVGSLSALRSESDFDVKSALSGGEPADVRSLEMRDSTVNFHEALGREQEKLKQQLLNQVGGFDGTDANSKGKNREKRASAATTATTETVLASSIRTKDLKIPGSFS